MSQKSNPDKLPSLPAEEKIIRFLAYLRKHTDKDHPLKSIKDAKEAFRKDGLHLGSDNTIRKIYKNIADACNMDIQQHPLPQSKWSIMYDGYVKLYGDADDGEYFGEDDPDEICEDREQFRNMYYVPEFSYEEIDALVEAVQFSPTLNRVETEKLISTLENKLTSEHYKKGARSIFKIRGKESCDRDLLRKNLLTIQQAIKDGVQIEYRFNGYTKDKRLAPMGDYKRYASPYYIVANDGRYYLMAANERYKHSGSYIIRIDLMTGVDIPERDEKSDQKGIPAIPKREVAGLPPEWEEDFPMRHIYMSYGALILIKMRIKNEKKQDGRTPKEPAYTFLHDYFGDFYRYLGVDENDTDYDIVTVRCTSFGMENFAMQFADKVEVLEPPELREKIREKVQRLAEKYGNPY